MPKAEREKLRLFMRQEPEAGPGSARKQQHPHGCPQ